MPSPWAPLRPESANGSDAGVGLDLDGERLGVEGIHGGVECVHLL
jgi:hypothetical protein